MKLKLWAYMAGLALCLVVQPVAAGRYEDASAAYHRKDYQTALKLWKPLAEQGDAKAQYNLGVMYAMGRGVPQDYTEAVKWFHKAAEQGYAKAQYNLGVMYDKGWGVPQNYAEAVKLYRKAAELGDIKVRYNLGVMYENGHGVTKDYVQARAWFSLAATSGEANAIKSNDRISKLMSPAQIAKAQKLASEWLAAHPQP